MAKITVYPTKASALNVKHPTEGQLKIDGSSWTLDGFTSRLISDGILTEEPAKAYRGPPPSSSTTRPAATSKSAAGPK